jgi:hypothetical protein
MTSLSFALLVLSKVGMKLNGTNVLYARFLPLSTMEARRDGVFFRVVHSVSDIENLRIDDTSMLYYRYCYKTYSSRRNCGFFKVESAGSDHKPDTSQVPMMNEQTGDTSTAIALCIFCGKHTFRKDRKLHKIKTAKRLQNVKDATEGQNVVACHSRR